MAINSNHIVLFKEGKEFDQVFFLDNFYENIRINEETEQNLTLLLNSAINYTEANYVKRSAFIILCDLTFINKITNPYIALGVLQGFLSVDENSLIEIALKYLPYFAKKLESETIDKVIELSDNSNAEVASQAYFSLGLIQLNAEILESNFDSLLVSLSKAKQNFQAAVLSIENRVDAEFYLLVIDWVEAVLSNKSESLIVKFDKLEKNLQSRSLYDFSKTGLEFDFLVFLLTEQIKASYTIASESKKWIEIKPNVQALLDVNLESQKIKSLSLSHHSLIIPLFENVFENIEFNIYEKYLVPERERLKTLRHQTQDNKLKKFINHLIDSFPTESNSQSENHELLALLVESIGAQEGLQMYQRMVNKSISSDLLKAIPDLLQKSINNKLPFRTGSIYGQEVLTSLIKQIDDVLPNYPKEKHIVFFNIIEEIIRYTRVSLVGNEKKRFAVMYSEAFNGLGQKAKEQDLQDSMIAYFEHSKIADGLGHEHAKFVDGGRVDIVYKKDLITIPIELKKSLNRQDETSLEQKLYCSSTNIYIRI